MSTNLIPRHHAHTMDHSSATESSALREAFSQMANGIKKPKKIAWKFYDAARGRPIAPLGSYPEIAAECIDSGGSFHFVARPLTVMLAHLRRRCTGKMAGDIKTAMVTAKRESDEAEVCAFRLALSMNCLGASDLSALSKEATEASLEWEKVKELADDRLAELEAK